MQQSDANQYTRVAQSPVQKITNFDDLDTNIINDRKRKRTEDESNTVKEKQVDDLDELIYSLGEREDSVEAPPVDANSVPTDLLLPQQDDSNETVPIVITKQPTPVPIVVVGAAAAAAAKEVVLNPVTSIDDDDFALSEEELRRIDEQVNQVLMVSAQVCIFY